MKRKAETLTEASTFLPFVKVQEQVQVQEALEECKVIPPLIDIIQGYAFRPWTNLQKRFAQGKECETFRDFQVRILVFIDHQLMSFTGSRAPH